MKWFTWEGVGVDRIASAWLIMRRIDPEPEFAFIPAGTSAPPDGGEAFDIPGVRYSHHRDTAASTPCSRPMTSAIPSWTASRP